MSEYNATYTKNINLEKPHKKQKYDIGVFNSNSDKIDAYVKGVKDGLDAHKKANPLDHADGSVQVRHLASIVSGGTYNGITFNDKGLITSAREVVVDAYTKAEVDEKLRNIASIEVIDYV